MAARPVAAPPCALAIVCLLLLLTAGSAAAFRSMPPGQDVHTQITKEAAASAGWPEGGVGALAAAIVQTDVEQIAWDPELEEPLGIRFKEQYDPSHHCDRLLPADNATAFIQTRDHIGAMRAEALAAPDAEAVVDATGRALHAVQDCFAHANYVDLPPGEQRRFMDALLNGSQPPPGLILAAVSDTHDQPGLPPDPYPHDRFAKDSAEGNAASQQVLASGLTAFEAARAAATDASAWFLEGIVDGLSPEMLAAIGALEQHPLEELQAPGLLVLAVAVLVCAHRRRQEPARAGGRAAGAFHGAPNKTAGPRRLQ